MKYDPIMCMMVDDSIKMKDGLDDPEKNAGYEMKKEGQYFKVYKNGRLIAMKSTEEEARREASRHRAVNDSNTLDKAIRNCDANWAEAYKEMENVMNKFSMQGISASIIYDRVKELYMKHKGDPAWETAWQKFNN